ncbi:RNA-directed DNA polymerase, eukaryota, reverse transcriptase zinc-binding domain protein, partial [Tanacetum coccineum]
TTRYQQIRSGKGGWYGGELPGEATSDVARVARYHTSSSYGHMLKCGDGKNTSFWNVAWRGDVMFKDLVPRLYMLESMKDIQVATKLSHEDLEWSFRRKPRGGVEQVQMSLLKEKIEGCTLSDLKDSWTWSLEGSGEFSVSSIRKVIDVVFLPCGSVKTRWVKEVPIKINIHAWKVINDYLPTRFNLSRRGMDIRTIVCPMCNCMVESSRHFFFMRAKQTDHVQDFEVVGFGLSGD